ncbi:MAG: hypothetical protein Q7U97_04835 [Rhodocyclaceae bacterium]|nr:hypothetical protein [Rhodocyclaceae bacterium]
MKHVRFCLTLIVLLAFGCLFFPEKAHAYLDPGTGSYILQIIIGAFLAGLFAIKIFWNKVKNLFRNLFQGKSMK